MNVKIEKATENDIPFIASFLKNQSDTKETIETLIERFKLMFKENYECFIVFDEDNYKVGIFGLWYLTRYYSGMTSEPDHVYIDSSLRSKGIGKFIFDWIADYSVKKGCNIVELNTFVENRKSHKFYYREGYDIYGFHMVKKLNDKFLI